jgi:UDP-N-acetylglucosamine diphosphorylase / glucose-1-phosphate thymidylyltransferase / UDP-N-acetylgalactosamine diphosphorylase / glucosamine-1-phosphate N-acetyltransferase / galactosamine-1-phosphate N-acetyltransferase
VSSICIFEDEGYKTLLPLTWFRPAMDLRCGMNTLFEKIKRCYPRTNIHILCREHLAPTVKKEHPGALIGKPVKESSVLFINGRLLCDTETAKKISLSGGDEIFECDGTIVAARLSKSNLELISGGAYTPDVKYYFSSVYRTAKVTKVSVKLVNYFFDLISHNSEEMKSDFSATTRGGITRGKVHQTIAFYQRSGIFIDDGADIEAFSTLDARNGPIYIDKNARIQPYSRVEGPCFIGEDSVIMTGANIRSGTSIGPNCKIGGEVEGTIFQGYSNKQHYGFLGHSYIGEWVNMGAGTTNSDLKNNYGNVKIHYGKTEVDSGSMFLGCVIADHTKLGIGALIPTGAVIGPASNIFGGGVTQKFIPSFSWGDANNLVKHDPEKAVKTARIVMSRRGKEMSQDDIGLFGIVFELTEDERADSGVI